MGPATTPTSTPPPTPTPPPPPAPPATGGYDVTVGNGVDADGFASLPLRSGAHRYFVSSSGSDANGCSNAQNPSTPLATLAAGVACVAAGSGDQVLLAEGSTFSERMPWLGYKGGYSAQYPTVISSYNPADPANENEYGRGDQRGARPVLNPGVALVSGGAVSYIAIKGLDFNPGNVSNQALTFNGDGTGGTGGTNDLLIENNIFRYSALVYTDGGDGTTLARSHHLIVRNNSMYGVWSSSDLQHIGGIYVEGNDSVTIEDNIIWHTGWKIGVDRNCGSNCGGPTVFNHPIYLQANADGIVRRNMIADNAADAGIARGNILWTENVSLRSPQGTGLGPGNAVDYAARPNGNNIEASYNLSVGAINIMSGGGNNDSGAGYTTANGTSGSRVDHNLLIYSAVELLSQNAVTFSNVANANQPSYMAFENNVSVHWVPVGQTHYDGGGLYPAQVHNTYNYNTWDNLASGTNNNWGTATFPHPYTESQLYAALTATYSGINDYASLVSYATAHPEAHVQRSLRSLAFAGYGL